MKLVRIAWHALAILQAAFGTILLVVSRSAEGSRSIVVAIALAYLAISVLAAIVTRGRHLVWVFYLGLAILVWWPW